MEKKIEILMEDNCTRKEAERYLKTGTIVYNSYDEYWESCIDCHTPADEIPTIKELRDGIFSGLSAVTYENHEYIIQYCL